MTLAELQKMFLEHYVWISKNMRNRNCTSQSLIDTPCLFVPSEDKLSFSVKAGKHLVFYLPSFRPYHHMLSIIPDYLSDSRLRDFLERIGEKERSLC